MLSLLAGGVPNAVSTAAGWSSDQAKIGGGIGGYIGSGWGLLGTIIGKFAGTGIGELIADRLNVRSWGGVKGFDSVADAIEMPQVAGEMQQDR